MSSRWDGILGGVKFRLLRQVDTPGYRRSFDKPPLEDPYITPGRELGVSPRIDLRTTFQDSWSAGRLWADPRFGFNTQANYLTASGLSATRRPGAIVQGNSIYQSLGAVSVNDGKATIAPTGFGTDPIKMVGSDIYTLQELTGVYIWFDTTTNLGGAGITYDLIEFDGEVYRLEASGAISSTAPASWSAAAPKPGAALVSGLEKTLPLYYDGEVLYELEAGGTLAVVTDDGQGPDALAVVRPTDLAANTARLAVGTSEGVWYVKNVRQQGQITPWVYRVERDGAGNIVSVPVATLPTGTLVTSVGYHMGTPMLVNVPASTGTNLPASVYAILNGSLGAIGSFEDTEKVLHFLFSRGNSAYFGGLTDVWEYEAVRGGLHPAGNVASGIVHSAVPIPDGHGVESFLAIGSAASVIEVGAGTITEGVGSGTFTSLQFDFDLPFHEKSLTKVMIWQDNIADTALQWRVQISTDEDNGSWTTVATFGGNDGEYQEAVMATPIAGRRFRYRILLDNTTPTADGAVTGIGFEAVVNTTREIYNLRVDGTEFMNVENEVVHPDDVYDAWVALGQSGEPVLFQDLMQHYEHESDSQVTGRYVKVETITIDKQDPGESFINVSLVVI